MLSSSRLIHSIGSDLAALRLRLVLACDTGGGERTKAELTVALSILSDVEKRLGVLEQRFPIRLPSC